MNFVKFLDDEGDSISEELSKLEKEKQFTDILEKHNLEINTYNEYIMLQFISSSHMDIEDMGEEGFNNMVREIKEINYLYKETNYKQLYEEACKKEQPF